MATTSSITTLDSTYTSLINYQIQLESKPLTALTTQQDALKLQRAVYNDLKTKLEALRSASKALISTDPFYSLKSGRTISVSNVETGKTVVSASTSSSAIASSYEITNISLALTDRVRSDEQEYADQALSQAGKIYIGGAAERTAAKKFQAVNNFGTAALTESNTKLTNGTYYIETRNDAESGWQFRLVDSSGTAQTIDGSGTDGWQNIVAGSKNTGRGLTINFGNDPLKYVAADKTSPLAASVSFSSLDDTFSITSSLNTVSDVTKDDTVAAGQLELGTGTYYVETRKDATSGWQFRLVDSEGNAAKIKLSSSSSYTNAWQAIPTGGGVYSTGRGLSIDFGTDAAQYAVKSKLSGAMSVDYQAKGAEIDVTADMSLNDIATAISSATYAAGNEVIATVVNKQLVLSSKSSGAAHKLQASGDVLSNLGILTGSAFKNVMQSAKDATFKVNGLSITRSQNSVLTDVISGVTLNLASDAEGESATITVASDNSASKAAINTFLANFNTTQSYMNSKMTLTKQTDGTYKRGSLSGDQSILSLRSSLFSMFSSYDATGGVYKSLKDIGIEINSSLTASVTNSAKLDLALKENFTEVSKLVDRVMTSINDKLLKYTGSTAYVDQRIKATDTQTKNVANQIKTWNTRLEQRKATLTNMYTDVQAQLTSLSYTQNTNSAWITSLYSSLYT